MPVVLHPGSRWQRGVVAVALLAACLPFAARVLVGSPGARVHVRWQASIDEARRHILERQFRLDMLERVDDLTWRYDLIDTSPENIRALVSHPAVADTHEIDRPNYTIAASALRTARRERFAYGSAVVATADLLAAALGGLAVLLALTALSHTVPALRSLRLVLTRTTAGMRSGLARIAVLFRAIAVFTSPAFAPLARFMQRGVPEIDASTAGLFRIVFGATTLAFFAYPTHHVDASWLSTTFDPEVEGPVHAWVMESLRARPFVVNLITPWLIATGIAFVAGAFTRLTYTLFVVGVLLWAYVAMSVDSTHPHSTLVLTLVALLPSRWGDARSIDSWLRLRRGREALERLASRRYGYSVWMPVLTFGVGFAAAAWAKLTVPPGWTSWILNGSIKYHIISDSASAPVTWGLQLVHHPTLAVLISFGAIAVESLVVTAAFIRNETYRLTMGLSALALFAGIAAFMGIVWPGWWIALLGFLPWQRWSTAVGPTAQLSSSARSPRPMAGRTLAAAQLVVVAAVVGQQVIVSALKLERAPMFSWYDMYSRSYADAADYNSSIPPAYHVFVAGDHGRAQLRCNPHEEFVRDFEAAVAGAIESRARIWRAIRGCGGDLSSARYITLEGNARTFDWDSLEFKLTHQMSLGPLAVRQDETTALR